MLNTVLLLPGNVVLVGMDACCERLAVVTIPTYQPQSCLWHLANGLHLVRLRNRVHSQTAVTLMTAPMVPTGCVTAYILMLRIA